MKIDKDYIAQLTLFEISGKIKEDEKAHLHQLISENETYYSIYNELHKQFTDYKLQEAREHLNIDQVWTAINARSRSNAVRRTMLGVAALFVFVIGTGLYLFINDQQTAVKNTLANERDHITLELADGQKLDLSNNHGKVQLGKTIFNNSNNQLTYDNNQQLDQFAMLVVPAGKNYTIRLVDGTEIQLNAETRLNFALAFKGDTREISIDGEAYIKVAKDATKPFLVHLPGATVHVLGTEFNVNTYDSGLVKVALVTGAINMQHKMDSTVLKPGFEISVSETTGTIVERFESEDVLAWREGIHLFNAASIEEVAKLVHRFYGINVKVDVQKGPKKPFTGSLNLKKPVQNFLEGLKFADYLDYYFDKDSTLYIK